MTEVGWAFVLHKPTGLTKEIYPLVTGATVSHDSTRQIRRTISGLTLLREDRDRIDLSADKLQLFLRFRGTTAVESLDYSMGIFNFTSSLRQLGAYRDLSEPESTAADLWVVELSDNLIRLHRNTGTSEIVLSGADPTFEMNRILDDADLLHAIAGSASDTHDDFTWDGSTTELDKFYQLAEVAGHRPPWADNWGIIRSVAATVVEEDVIELELLGSVVEDSVSITENYLTAPNRVIVVDSGPNAYAIRGQWDAPSSAPHSFSNRGYVQTEIVSMQGLSSTEHANTVAETLGEQYAARQLNLQLAHPNNVFDGPVVVRFDQALWLVNGWSVSLDPGSYMQVNATEIFLP